MNFLSNLTKVFMDHFMKDFLKEKLEDGNNSFEIKRLKFIHYHGILAEEFYVFNKHNIQVGYISYCSKELICRHPDSFGNIVHLVHVGDLRELKSCDLDFHFGIIASILNDKILVDDYVDIKGLRFVCICNYPEKYIVFNKKGNRVGYVYFNPKFDELVCKYPDAGGRIIYLNNDTIRCNGIWVFKDKKTRLAYLGIIADKILEVIDRRLDRIK